ncbi:hypothetical protein CC2G_013055 [Coprinopsis cinerea AmutBmut pab1-1]|nr:hypothetical protein CC2G_013055 [Coprinopsis cinerea AmutBmut pab1-1]
MQSLSDARSDTLIEACDIASQLACTGECASNLVLGIVNVWRSLVDRVIIFNLRWMNVLTVPPISAGKIPQSGPLVLAVIRIHRHNNFGETLSLTTRLEMGYCVPTQRHIDQAAKSAFLELRVFEKARTLSITRTRGRHSATSGEPYSRAPVNVEPGRFNVLDIDAVGRRFGRDLWLLSIDNPDVLTWALARSAKWLSCCNRWAFEDILGALEIKMRHS